MNYFNVNQDFISKIILAICRTLLHSLWQGLILAIVAGLILSCTKKAKPAVRYTLLSISLLIFVLTSAFVLFLEFRHQTSKSASFSYDLESGTSLEILPVHVSPDLVQFTNKEYWQQLLDQFIRKNAALIVAVWLLFFSLKTLKAVGGFWYINRLKSRNNYADEDWIVYLQQLADKLGIHKNIQLFQSEMVSVPMVTGIIKPIIFVPIGFFTQLPLNQIEAILLHELAHIRRNDYAVNLIQNLCENVFFFNPAVLWISFLIREEREHCCDDLAISVTQNRSSFVQALVSFQEYKFADQSLVVAFPGKRNFLLDRIKRIIYKNNKPLDAMEKLFVTASLITAVLLTAAFSPAIKKDLELLKPKPEKVLVTSEMKTPFLKSIKKDTLPERRSSYHLESINGRIQADKNNKRYEIESTDGKLASLKIDGQQIPEDKFASYKVEVDEIMLEVKKAHEEAEVARADADKAREKADVMREEADKHRKEADQMREQADKMRTEAASSRLSADAERKQAGEERKLADLNRLEAEKLRGEADKLRGEADGMRLKADENRRVADEMRKKADIARKEADKSRVAYEKMQSDLIQDLVKEGVIKNSSNLSYRLNSDELIVNGVKQSAELHKKFKSKYVEGSGWETVYNFNGRTGLIITK